MSDRVRRINPPNLHRTPGYHHVTVVEAGRLAFLVGQCPLARDGTLVGAGSYEKQTDQVIDNALTVLAAVQARPEDVVRSTIYVVSDDERVLGAVWRRLTASALGEAFTSASTLLGVAKLGFPGQLVELDLMALLPPSVSGADPA
jgi:enamine deaminase RidA (YjgF/YER057c/UK114 family)